MSALARVLLADGVAVSGSDLKRSHITDDLAAAGADIREGHRPENVHGADLVVATAAARADNPELREAERLGIPIKKRAVLLGELMAERRGIAVAGTHGKTTTTAMIAHILTRAGLDPTALIGGELVDTGSNARRGRGEFLVAEADEYDGSFLQLHPAIAVVTNVEADHLDFYGTMDALQDAFRRFLTALPPYGLAVICGDDPGARAIAPAGAFLYGFE